MPLWSDDFNRADGPLGNNWTGVLGSAAISTNAVAFSGTTVVVQGPVTGPGAAMAECTVQLAGAVFNACGPAVKVSPTTGTCYWAHVYVANGNTYYTIYAYTVATQFNVASFTQTGYTPSSLHLRLTYTGGTLTLYADGVQKVQGNNTTYAANQRIGMFSVGTNGGADNFSCSGDGQAALYVTPAIVGTEDGDVPIALMATAVTWTVGSPGSPSFTCNAGALSGQVIDSTTNARAIFTPPATAQTVTIADPANGITDTITVVEGTYQGGGTGGMGGLSEAAVGWLEAQAAHGGLVLADNDETTGEVEGISIKGAFGELLLGKRKAVGESPYPDYLTAVLADLYARAWGGEEWQGVSFAAPGTNSIMTVLSALAEAFTAFRDPSTFTIQDMMDGLRGTGDYTHADLKTAIDAIQGGDNQEVLDAIAAAQGDPLATIKAAIDLVYALGTTSNYDLADVQTWVQAVQGAGLPTVKAVVDKLALIQPTPAASIDTIRNDIAALGLVVVAVQTLLGTVNGTVGSIAEVATDILDIVSNLPTTVIPPQRPVWPGVANVTLGAEVALSNGLTIAGPLHGLLFTITEAAPRAQKYLFGTVASWSRVGAVIFESDRGDFERSQTFSIDTQVMVPMTMEVADSAIIRLNTGWVGTVRPWIRAE